MNFDRGTRIDLCSILCVTLLMLSSLLAGCNSAQSDSQQQQAAPAPEVTVSKPLKLKIVEWDAYTGRLAAINAVEVRPRVSGYLKEKFFVDGDMVTAGQHLFTIDPKPFEALLAEADAEQVEAETRLSQAKAQLAQSQAMLEQTQATLELARKRNARTEQLFNQGVSTQDELDLSSTELTEAQSSVLAARAAIKASEAGVETANAGIVTAKSKVTSARLELKYTKIYAPISGRISEDLISIGNLVNAGNGQESLLTTIVSLNPIHCYFDANEQELLKYTRLDRSGKRKSSRDAKNPVYMAVVDEQGFPHLGHMDFVENRIDEATGSIRGRAIFPNDDEVLAPGMFTRIRLPGSGSYEAILLPDLAVGSEQTIQYVLIVNAENVVERKEVKTGPLSHGLRVIREGLNGDETVIINGIQRAKAGQPVKLVEGTIESKTNGGLPDEYQAVPKEEWLNQSIPQKAVLPTDVGDDGQLNSNDSSSSPESEVTE